MLTTIEKEDIWDCKMATCFQRLKRGTLILLLQQSLAVLAFSFVLIFFKEQGYELWKLLLMYVIS
ncbi:MAG: hypothetical protein AB1668_04060, partial [Nanoarchaeota archaeon]